MAPEQVDGKGCALTRAADVYGLGVILYETLVGAPPFRSDSASETFRRILAEEPPRPYRSSAGIPRDLETIALKCLEKDPWKGYGGAGELADDLQRFPGRTRR
jgi:serine/threonine protein kinase